MDKDADHAWLLYELAMSIGSSRKLETTLYESLAVFVRRLECTGALVLRYCERNDGLLHRETTLTLPTTLARTLVCRALVEKLPAAMTHEEYQDVTTRSPLVIEDDKYIVALTMPRFGILYLIRAQPNFDPELIDAIRPVVRRLAEACGACVREQEVRKARKLLEERVNRRTQMLEESLGKLADACANVKSSQRQLVQSEKLASIGRLAAGVAHEINNPTGFVASNLETMHEYVQEFRDLYLMIEKLQTGLASGDETAESVTSALSDLAFLQKAKHLRCLMNDAAELVKESLDGTKRIKGIVQDLRTFAHPDGDQFAQVAIEQAVQNAIRLSRNEIGHTARIDTSLSPGLTVNCRIDQLAQVFLNAAQAMKSKGTIKVISFVDQGEAVVRVSDTGSGISQSHMGRLFDPFFTTKHVGEGTGLGLWISHGIIARHGGRITVTSTQGQGATFDVRLPLAIENTATAM